MGMLWLAGSGSIASILAGILWWWIPKWQMRSITVEDSKARADIEDNFRKTVGQALGGIAVLIGAGMAYYGTQQTLLVSDQQSRRSLEVSSEQSRRSLEASDKQAQLSLEASRALLISQQVSKGFEQLGSDKTVVRLGGIYALEGVMNDSEAYHKPILEALCAFVRDGTKTHTGNDPPATDIQAVLIVLGRRKITRQEALGLIDIDLTAARIQKASLRGIQLPGVNLSNATLSGVELFAADLTEARLFAADLSNARLMSANLSNAHLEGANLSGARLLGANLSGVDLRNVKGMSQSLLDEACGTDAKLPADLTLKPCLNQR
jgi:hypothetical protein